MIRLNSPLSPERVGELKIQFSDILKPHGDIGLSGPLEEESDERNIDHLPRLILDFNRKDLGRLKTLIDAINKD